MVKLLAREGLLILLTGLFGMFAVPAFVGQPPAGGLFSVVLVMALAFVSMYAMSVLAGNKMPARVRHWLGLIGWVGAFGPDLALMAQLAGRGAQFPLAGLYMWLAPGLFGLVLMVVGAAAVPSAERRGVALSTLYAYSFPMLGVRWLLVPLVGADPGTHALVMQSGAVYMALRVLVRIFWPGSVEGDSSAPPLVRRPIPDAVVGLVEGTARRGARPFATLAGGELDEGAISVLARPEELHAVVTLLEEALQDKPFRVFAGEAVAGQVEVVVRSV
jgi:hypothetical protein